MRGKSKKGYTVGSSQTGSLHPPLAALRLFPCAIKIPHFRSSHIVPKMFSGAKEVRPADSSPVNTGELFCLISYADA